MDETTPPTIDDVLAHLRDSLDDLRLSTTEKRELAALLEASRADEEALRRVRNVAFDLVRSQLGGGDAVMARLGWLERVSKVLDLARTPTATEVPTEAWFSPGDDCREAVRRALRRARAEVCICVFTISDDRISEAILETHRRGVSVRILTDNDKRYDAGSDIDRLRRAGIPIAEDSSPAHMHHKFALYDGRVLHTGSFNWTRSASRANEENLLQTGDPAAVAPFADRFERLWRRFAG
ncbi:MAG: hypothetical protein KDH20_19990 [Rhodocyclaceae bacterium]|nr:hypothetical protein [Rhodocyclaceae bacterium]